MILVEWSSQESFRAFLDDPELKDLRLLHEGGTRNYLWWIYERLEDLRSLFQTQLDERSILRPCRQTTLTCTS